ncbi:MAG TPA: nucleotide disphospho-sugar-binding domain-containing protein, partial [Thermomicrobiales bacterium]|nr:nucleotide disphospho-sugar-binding domain-containing protein [Thermomicrobiales bacterium]
AFGPTNNCIGIAEDLQRLGHRAVFVVEESFAGTLAARGFDERTMRLQPPPDVPEEPGQFWKDFIRDTAPHFRESPQEQIATLTAPIWEQLVAGSVYVEPRLREIFAEVRPDAIVEDNVILFPAVATAGVPWARIVSCNPLEIADPDLPPALSGLPLADRSGWAPFRQAYQRRLADLHAGFAAEARDACAPELPNGEFMVESPWLNLSLYPEELDYPRSTPLAATWRRIDSSVRAAPPFDLPEALRRHPGPLLYVSLGSLGSAEPELMGRLIDLLGRSSYRAIVSLGPQAGRIDLPPNVWGEEFLPQPSIMPLVDAVITHGGNNTVTECMHFGKPMLALPLFWDQHDNAQRVAETGFGHRLAPYAFSDADFFQAVDDLLTDDDRRARLTAAARRIQGGSGTAKAARLIARLAETQQPIVDGA